MTSKLLLALVTSLIVCFSVPVAAQAPQLSLPTINQATENAIISMPITVQNFDSILSIGMVIKWDPSVIRFLGVSDYTPALPDFDSDDIGTTQATNGELRVVWWKFTFNGFDMADGDTLFVIRYRIIGPLNSGTPVEFTELNPELIFEIQKANNQTFSLQDMNLENGFVAVGYTVPVQEQTVSSIPLTLSPNPIRYGDALQIRMNNPTEEAIATFTFLSSKGQILYSEEKSIVRNEGTYTIPMLDGAFTTTNMWLLIEIGSERILKKIIVLP